MTAEKYKLFENFKYIQGYAKIKKTQRQSKLHLLSNFTLLDILMKKQIQIILKKETTWTFCEPLCWYFF